MSQRTGNVECGVCQSKVPAAFADRHHVTPQSVGSSPDNSSDNLIWLCSGCHQNLHTLSHFIIRGAMGEAKDLALSYYNENKHARRVLVLAKHAAQEMVAVREGERDLPETVQISVEVPREIFTLLKLMSIEARGHRQFSPFIRDHLLGLARKYKDTEEDSNLPEVDTLCFL